MSSFAVILLCIQAFLIQNIFGYCYGAGAKITAPCGLSAEFAGPYEAGIAKPFTYKSSEYGSVPCGAKYADSGLTEYGAAGLAGNGAGCGQAYGGSGIGNVAVAGELPVGGSTAIVGKVPIIGTVKYAGPLAAAGAITIAGNCRYDCGIPGAYSYGF